MPTALISGVSGQDGSYLSELLVEKGYEVHGIIRRQSVAEHQESRIHHLEDKITTHYGDVMDLASLRDIFERTCPDEVYNLAAQSHVRISYDVPIFTSQTNAIGALNVIDTARRVVPNCKYYQASSVTGDTPVLVRAGGKIQRVSVSDTLKLGTFDALSHDPVAGRCRFMPVTKVHDHGYRRVWNIVTNGSGRLRVTADHSVFVWTPDGPAPRRTDELQAGDLLVTLCGTVDLPTKPPAVTTYWTISKHIPSRWCGTARMDHREEQRTFVIDKDLARLCGYYLAEGCCDSKPRRHRVTWTFGDHKHGSPAATDAAELIFRYFNKHPRYNYHHSSRQLFLCGKEAVSFFSQFGCTSRKKRLPWFIWELPYAESLEFLRGYSQDAKLEACGGRIFSTVSKGLHLDMVYFCRVRGIPVRRFTRAVAAHPNPQGTTIAATTVYDIHMPTGIFEPIKKGSRTPSPLCLPSMLVTAAPATAKHVPKTKIAGWRHKRLVGREVLSRYLNPDVLADQGLGVAEIRKITPGIQQRVYDFEVPGSERFFSGSIPLLAHNSSEMFGNSFDEDGFQRETTSLNPVSPYGIAKVFAYNTVRHYRHAYKMHATNGILFNHESPRRGSNFVTAKVVKQAVEIYRGMRNELALGNMDSKRDWGHSRDYVQAMHTMLQHDEPGDWVVSTGVAHSVRDLCSVVFSELGMDYEDYVVQDPKYMRPEELKFLCGDSTKIREELGWAPEYDFYDLIKEVIDYWLTRIPALP